MCPALSDLAQWEWAFEGRLQGRNALNQRLDRTTHVGARTWLEGELATFLSEHASMTWTGDWLAAFRALKSRVSQDQDLDQYYQFLGLAISALELCVQVNFTGLQSELVSQILTPFSVDPNLDAEARLWFYEEDGEGLVEHVHGGQLLFVADQIFKFLEDIPAIQNLWSYHWWYLRAIYIRQVLHTDNCRHEFREKYFQVLARLEALPTWKPTDNPELASRLDLEVVTFYGMFDEFVQMQSIIERVAQRSGFAMEETGKLGKRTKFQHHDLPQLTLEVKTNSVVSAAEDASDVTLDLPQDLKLDDEVRLDKIKFADPEAGHLPGLTEVDQAVILGEFFLKQRSKPKDEFVHEELRPYIDTVLGQPRPRWAFKMSLLLARSKLEALNRRTMERSMMQVQTLVDHLAEKPKNPQARLDGLYMSRLPPYYLLERELCTLFQSLGSTKAALDIALKMNFWEDMINCYHQLQLRHKAAEVIRGQLEKGETPLLYCMLGDATDDLEHYEKALAMTNDKSARAWRALGIRHYYHKDYPKAVECLQKSLQQSPYQPSILLRLGYAAIQTEDWEVSASAYRSYCHYEYDNFEAWNNLSNAYIKLGQKSRAWKVLQEAVKSDFDNWRIWDNILVVSTDCAAFDEVIKAYHRLLDLKDKHVDTDVLGILVQAIRDDLKDNAGEPSSRHLNSALKLFGRLTSQVTNEGRIWELYSDLTFNAAAEDPEKRLKACQYLQKATACCAQKSGWEKDTDKAEANLKIALKLAEKLPEVARQPGVKTQSILLVASSKMTLKGIAIKVKQHQTSVTSGEIVDSLTALYIELNESLTGLESLLVELKG